MVSYHSTLLMPSSERIKNSDQHRNDKNDAYNHVSAVSYCQGKKRRRKPQIVNYNYTAS